MTVHKWVQLNTISSHFHFSLFSVKKLVTAFCYLVSVSQTLVSRAQQCLHVCRRPCSAETPHWHLQHGLALAALTAEGGSLDR